METLASIGGEFWIQNNEQLTDISSLSALQEVGENMGIIYNTSLSSLEGLNNISPGSIFNLNIHDNPLLTHCAIESICNYLLNPAGEVQIHDNAAGCDSQIEVEEACGSNCLPEGITFHTQEQIDNFQSNYPTCTEIEGDVEISGDDIISLEGLNVLTSIGGGLLISDNTILTSLSGLESLVSIGDDFRLILNDSLTSINALENLTTIFGSLSIGTNFMGFLFGNLSLVNISSFNHEISIEGDLEIIANPSLSFCEVESICDYLASPNGTINIYLNAPGCNSQTEVEDACWTKVDEVGYDDKITISPNPSSGSMILRYTISDQRFVICDLFEISGNRIKTLLNEIKIPGTYKMEIDLTDLKPGIYFCRLKIGNEVIIRKVVKVD